MLTWALIYYLTRVTRDYIKNGTPEMIPSEPGCFILVIACLDVLIVGGICYTAAYILTH